jgi:hypothetical protein
MLTNRPVSFVGVTLKVAALLVAEPEALVATQV